MKPNILLQQLENALPKGMQIPEELRKFYQWIEDNGYYDQELEVAIPHSMAENPITDPFLKWFFEMTE